MEQRKDIRLGWKKDPFDPKAWEFKPKLLARQEQYSLEKYRVPTLDQDGVGACVGFGIDGILTIALNILGIPDFPGSVNERHFSPTDIYNGGRFIDGTLRYDEGTYASSALTWLSKKDCLPYMYWRFTGFEMNSRPSSLDPYAAKWPLAGYNPLTLFAIGYYRVVNGASGIMDAIAAGHAVAIGVPWPDLWMSSKDGVLKTPKTSDSIAGGHEVYLYGYDNQKQIFYGANSWGTTQWSYTGTVVPKGCFSMPYAALDYFKKNGGYDAHIVDVEWEKEPVPPEPPEPEPTTGTYEVSGTLKLVSAGK